jgi:mannose/cellobiose epimerase-like protein (N-acyl-D-glucosamine 2-epimerase family)
VVEHFAADWTPLPDYNSEARDHPFRPYGVTPGHGLEWARLLLGLHAALEAPPRWLIEAAERLFERAVADGWVEPGGFVYTTDRAGVPVVERRLHWVVTEAIGAAAVLHEATGRPQYEAWYRRAWDFADAHLLDRAHGSWRHELDAGLQPVEGTWSGKPDIYHALQATLIPRLPLSPSLAGALRAGLLR